MYNIIRFHFAYRKEVCSVKKTICKIEFDTETATLVKAYSFGELGDPAGYEEVLY